MIEDQASAMSFAGQAAGPRHSWHDRPMLGRGLVCCCRVCGVVRPADGSLDNQPCRAARLRADAT